MEVEADHRICRTCNKVYTTNSSLQRHLRASYSINLFKCKYCPKNYKRISYLNTHIAKAHGEFSEVYPVQMDRIPNTKRTDTSGLAAEYTTDRACSPIDPDLLHRYPSLETKAREICTKQSKVAPPTAVGTIRMGKVVPSFRLERKWTQKETPNNPLPVKKFDKEQIKLKINQPKRLVKFPASQIGKELDDSLFKRKTDKTPVQCPKKIKVNVMDNSQHAQPSTNNPTNMVNFSTLNLTNINFEYLCQIPAALAKIENQPKATTSQGPHKPPALPCNLAHQKPVPARVSSNPLQPPANLARQ